MSSVKTVIQPNSYRDSIFLMKLSAQAARESGAEAVSAMMATERNKDLFKSSGLFTPEVDAANPNDLAIVIKGDGAAMDEALAIVKRLLDAQPERAAAECGQAVPVTIRQAARQAEGLNFALISVAGDYARYEAAEALRQGMDVMLYSDNISLDDEIALKTLATKKGRLVMGPDCGTAIIDGVPLAFANAVRRGPVGVVGASGTGLQEVVCLLDRLGVGISQAYGTGGRDLKDAVGGMTTLGALDRLLADPDTKALVILGKPPGDQTRKKIVQKLKGCGLPMFVHYIGATGYAEEQAADMVPADTLADLALAAAKYLNPDARLAEDAVPAGKVDGGWLCGLFGGGTLCQEAAALCADLLPGAKASNLSVPGYTKVSGRDTIRDSHVFWDLGEDEFTVGRPHPMMAPDLKMDRLVDALCDSSVSVVLMDMVIGYGSHPEQGNLALDAIATAKTRSNGASASTIIVASVCGTEGDSPSRSSEAAMLRQAGVVVLPTNAAAARYAASLFA